MDDTTIFGITNFRNGEKKFGIKMDDRRRHMYLVGKTGAAKTTVMETMVVADIKAGKGVCFVDPHGDTAERILEFVPEERINDVIYFNPQDINFPIAFNPLEQVDTEYRHLVASGIMGVFKKIWVDMWSARMEYILNNTLLALLEYPGSTLLGIMRMLSDKDYRKRVVDSLNDPVVKGFWVNEFAKYSQKFETEATAAIQNKVGQFVTNPLIRNILGQAHSSIDMRKIMDEGKILIVNLSKGGIGEDNSNLLGAMIISKIQLAAMSRMNIPENERKDFYLYVDEFQNFATDSFATILSEARKYHLCLIMAHQYIRQLISGDSTKMRDAVFGNVGTMISFRVGAEDAEFLEKEFQPDFMLNDLVNLPKFNFYIKLMIDGVASRPFSAKTIPPPKAPAESYKDVLIENSRRLYSTPRISVEEKIAAEWTVTGARMSEDRMLHKDEHRLSEILKPMSSKTMADEPSLSEIVAGAGEPSSTSAMADEGKKDRQSKHLHRPESFGKDVRPSSVEALRTSPSTQLRTSKKKVDIADLKKALEQSLAKNFGDEEEVKEGASEKPEENII